MPKKSACVRTSSEDHEGPSMKVQVMRHRNLKRIVYLKCGKDFADLLLTLLTLPVGTILKLISSSNLDTRHVGERKPGIFNLHSSLEDLEESMLHVQKTVLTEPETRFKPSFLSITGSVSTTCVNSQCTNKVTLTSQLCEDCECIIYNSCETCEQGRRSHNHHFFSTSSMSANCGHHSIPLRPVVALQRRTNAGSKASIPTSEQVQQQLDRGFAKDKVTFMIKEGLSIVKSSTITSMALLMSYKIKSFEDLETEEIYVGRNEGLLLVRAALQSSRPLTEVFEPLLQG